MFKNKSHAQRHIDNTHPSNVQNDLKPQKQSKNEPKLIDISSKQSKNTSENNSIIQSFEPINTFVFDSGTKIDSNNNNLINFSFDRPAYSNLIWSNPSTSSTSPNSTCISQSPINQTNTNLFILNNANINQHNMNENVNITNQSFFI